MVDLGPLSALRGMAHITTSLAGLLARPPARLLPRLGPPHLSLADFKFEMVSDPSHVHVEPSQAGGHVAAFSGGGWALGPLLTSGRASWKVEALPSSSRQSSSGEPWHLSSRQGGLYWGLWVDRQGFGEGNGPSPDCRHDTEGSGFVLVGHLGAAYVFGRPDVGYFRADRDGSEVTVDLASGRVSLGRHEVALPVLTGRAVRPAILVELPPRLRARRSVRVSGFAAGPRIGWRAVGLANGPPEGKGEFAMGPGEHRGRHSFKFSLACPGSTRRAMVGVIGLRPGTGEEGQQADAGTTTPTSSVSFIVALLGSGEVVTAVPGGDGRARILATAKTPALPMRRSVRRFEVDLEGGGVRLMGPHRSVALWSSVVDGPPELRGLLMAGTVVHPWVRRMAGGEESAAVGGSGPRGIVQVVHRAERPVVVGQREWLSCCLRGLQGEGGGDDGLRLAGLAHRLLRDDAGYAALAHGALVGLSEVAVPRPPSHRDGRAILRFGFDAATLRRIADEASTAVKRPPPFNVIVQPGPLLDEVSDGVSNPPTYRGGGGQGPHRHAHQHHAYIK